MGPSVKRSKPCLPNGVDFEYYEENVQSNECDICLMILWSSDKAEPLFSFMTQYIAPFDVGKRHQCMGGHFPQL